MDPIDLLPDIEREILKQLYFAPGHTSTVDDLWGKVYYQDSEITSAIESMIDRDLLVYALEDPELLTLPPIVLLKLVAKNNAADAELQKGLSNLSNSIEAYKKERE
jgi:hypothetical protein